AAELEEIILASHARRGGIYRASGALSDVLRSVGLALDQLHALDVRIDLSADALNVRFSDQHGEPHVLRYADEELEAVRRAAVARRNGQPLRRVLILHIKPASAASLGEVLVAEFAVQALPTLYARAVAEAAEAPDLVLAQGDNGTLSAMLRTLRAGKRTARVPILVLAPAEGQLDPEAAYADGADDLLQEPVLPALLRARL